MKMSRKKVAGIVLVALLVIAVVVISITYYQIDVIMSEGETDMVNRDNYILMSFELRESSGNAMVEGDSYSQSFRLSFESIYIDTPQTDGYKRISLDEINRKNLEAELLVLIEKHSLQEWNGFDEYLEVMDASGGFSFNVTYKDESEIVASGGFMYPDNYDVVFSEAKEIFLKYSL